MQVPILLGKSDLGQYLSRYSYAERGVSRVSHHTSYEGELYPFHFHGKARSTTPTLTDILL